MVKELKIALSEMIMCLSGAIDLISPVVVDHHKRVAYIAFRIAQELALSQNEKSDLIMAGALHDIGALSLGERISALNFEMEDLGKHPQVAYLLLQEFQPLSKVASLVRYHHLSWLDDQNLAGQGVVVPANAHILHLADRIDVLINRNEEILGQVERIRESIKKKSGTMFKPEIVYAFLSLAEQEAFWLDIISPSLTQLLIRKSSQDILKLNLAGLLDLAKLFSRIIDFRSRFTATHSSGVAASAEVLARLLGLSRQECQMMRVAGYLHDLGKLAVPTEILEKPGSLTTDEYNVIKSHTFHTYRILENIDGLATINAWASYHHERLDGQGYPFRYGGESLCQGARIMAVADVFTAITEDRPYRSGMTKERCLKILQDMADSLSIDCHIVKVLEKHYEELNHIRRTAQREAAQEYREFWHRLS